MQLFKRNLISLGLAFVPAALFAAPLYPQAAKGPAMHITTQERLETETWWPTMATAPLKAYTGSADCIRCHADQNAPLPTGMSRAATTGSEPHSLPVLSSRSFVSGGFTYSLMADSLPLRLSVSRGERRATQTVDWVIGAGDLGRTFLYNTGGHWFQSEATLYTQRSMLDLTTGFGPSTSTSPMGALGNLLSPAEARACFGCHTVHATTSAGLDPLHAEPGIGCEACHGPGRKHADKIAAEKTQEKTGEPEDLAIFQPAKLSPSDSIDFCGSCHRSFADASLSTGPQVDRAVVRFQPYRLEESTCWRATQDERLTCVACHDPHKPLNHVAASYDANCLQCHSTGKHNADEQRAPTACPKATHDCVTCHMPKVNLPSMHGDFTDHYIRIAREGETLPR